MTKTEMIKTYIYILNTVSKLNKLENYTNGSGYYLKVESYSNKIQHHGIDVNEYGFILVNTSKTAKLVIEQFEKDGKIEDVKNFLRCQCP